MNQRGRRSAASLSVVSFPDVAMRKPDAPKHLGAEQKKVWRDIVAAMKAQHFAGATELLLEIYCNVVVRLRSIEQLLREVDPEVDFKRYRMLMALQCQQSMLLCSLASRLRLLKPNRSARDNHEVPGPKPWELRKPWQDDPEDKPA